MRQPAPDVDRQTLERVELALPEWAGEFEVLERNLRFDGTQLAHWLAYSQGRVLFVSVVNGHADTAVLRAMDGLSFAQNQPEILAASLADIDDDNPSVQIVLVALEGYSKLQLERLGTLPADRLTLLRRRELSTARGTHTRMEAVECTEGGRSGPPVTLPDWSLEPEFRTFLARIAPDRLQLALTVVERMRRMDPQFGWQPEGTGLACFLEHERLARLNWAGGYIQIFFHDDLPSLPVRDNASLESALEAVLDRYLDLLSGGRSNRRRLDLSASSNDPSSEFGARPLDRGSMFDDERRTAPYREPNSELARNATLATDRDLESAQRPGLGSEEFREPDRRPSGLSERKDAKESSSPAATGPSPDPEALRPTASDFTAAGHAESGFVPMTGASTSERAESPDSGFEPKATPKPRTVASAPAATAGTEEALDDLADLDEVEIQPLPPGPLLTAEEIEAFLE